MTTTRRMTWTVVLAAGALLACDGEPERIFTNPDSGVGANGGSEPNGGLDGGVDASEPDLGADDSGVTPDSRAPDATPSDGGPEPVRETVSLDLTSCLWAYSSWPDSMWHASRLTPSSYPFIVERVRYRTRAASSAGGAISQIRCDGTLDEEVVLVKTTTEAPPAEVTPDWQQLAPNTGSSTVSQDRDIRVDPPLRLEPGESLWVIVRTGATEDATGCIRSCLAPFRDAGRSYLGSAEESVVTWINLAEFSGEPDAYLYELEGYAAPE